MPKIFVVVAHPDDEIGCGGTIAKYSKEYEISCLILGEGKMSREGVSYDQISLLRKQSEEAAVILGIKYLAFDDFPDNQFDSKPLLSIIKSIEQWTYSLGTPDYVFTHHSKDLNIDHRITSQAVQTVFRPEAFPGCKGLFFFEMPSSTNKYLTGDRFFPRMYVDISEALSTKLKAFEKYGEEVKLFPHARSIEGMISLARYRGTLIGYEAAEAFMVGYLKEPL